MTYSIVVPIYNEEGNVEKLHADIKQTMEAIGEPYEIIFVNDGSSDNTMGAMKYLFPLTIINFNGNFGQTAAMDAGIKHATGNYIITMDGDGQNPPSEIPKLIEELQRGDFDVVSGWRFDRKDSFMKHFVSRTANVLRGILIKDGIHDSGCSLKIYKRACFAGVDLFGEMHRFIPALLSLSGYRIGEVKVKHQPRTSGVTKYNWRRGVKGFVDMLNIWFLRKYASRPLHLFGALSLLLNFSGVALLFILFIARIFFNTPISTSNLPLVAVLLIVVGVQLFVSGILIDLNIKQLYSGDRTYYAIKDVITRGPHEPSF